MTTEAIERKYPVSSNEVGKPLSQQELYDLLEERKESLVFYDWLVRHARVIEVFESLRTDKNLPEAEVLKKIEEPDASVINLEFRWPVKADIITQEHEFGAHVKKAKSYPATYNSIIVTLDRVQNNAPTLDFKHIVTIEGGDIELMHWVSGSLHPGSVRNAIKKAFLNPRTKCLQEENPQA